MTDEFNNQAGELNFVPSADLGVLKSGKTQNLVDILVHNFQKVEQRKPGHKSATNQLTHDIPRSDLKLYEVWLAEAHSYFRKASQQKLSLTYASEWVLDNYYIIQQALQQIKEDLPINYYRQLPKLVEGPLKGFPRIYAITSTVLSFQNQTIDIADLKTILVEYQPRVPLTMGELWALPIFLRYGLIESLSHTLVSIIHPSVAPHLPDAVSLLAVTHDPLPIREDNREQSINSDNVANTIQSLRTVSEQNWSHFFEDVSDLEGTLRQDPAGIYPCMDFKTRDLYRKEIEGLSFATGVAENELAKIILNLARNTQNGIHVGEFLLGNRRETLEQQIGYRPDVSSRFRRNVFRHASVFYISGIWFLTLLVFTLIVVVAKVRGVPDLLFGISGSLVVDWVIIVIFALAMLFLALSAATSLVNWLITLKVPPRILPKMDFRGGIPDEFQTLVVIPALITNHEEIQSLAQQLELHYLCNPESGLRFALLTDFCDADTETLPEDEELLRYAEAEIEKLNAKYKPSVNDRNNEGFSTHLQGSGKKKSAPLFYFFPRKRLLNPSESQWMGWERKRGKLHELNLLLRGGKDLSFIETTDVTLADLSALRQVRFVITLDTDTLLPRGAACRLAGTLAHPLNQAIFDASTGQVVSGYTVLQPRMEIHPRSANHSWFTRFFAGDSGLDLYTRAVSDAYQDLFGEGIYVGKGIYDVDAFERCVDKHIQENTVLSHDLLEGLMGRAGLVTDITMIEDYPQNYFIQVMRQRRWIRGDWQLLPWLLHSRRSGLVFSAIDLWKIFDNLRRALLMPMLLFIFVVGFLVLPELAGFLTALVLISLGIPLFTSIVQSAKRILEGEYVGTALRPLGWTILRWLLAIAFLPYEAYISADAMFTTLYRMLISHRNLLQWTTAAQTAHIFGLQNRRNTAWQKMIVSSVMALFLLGEIVAVSGLSSNRITLSILSAFPVFFLWLISPLLVWWIDRPIARQKTILNEEQVMLLRQVTRRTWGFFERFVGPEDHWLPPDHYQESPVGKIAHRTSPTNIGLLLTSTLAAYDLGYLDQLGVSTRLFTVVETLGQLELFRGHFLNWYDTLTLKPLYPRYISTVDSGNLAASLLVTAQACKSMPDEPIFRWDLWRGYLDTLANLTETLTGMIKPEFDQQVAEINQSILVIHDEILAVRPNTDRWYALFQKISGSFWQDLSKRLMELIEVGRSAFDLTALEKLQEVTAQVERHHLAVQRTITELIPWVSLFEHKPVRLLEPEFVDLMITLRSSLPNNLTVRQILPGSQSAFATILLIKSRLAEQDISNTGLPETDVQRIQTQIQLAKDWLDELEQVLVCAQENSKTLTSRFEQLKIRIEKIVEEMDFSYLYDKRRRVFHIGYNIDADQLDQNYYDLLASEARIASIIAIAKGDVPQAHWLQLSRPVTRVDDSYALLSWSGTMFEYLMPPLFLRSYPDTLLSESTHAAVLCQIEYGKAKAVPWGISESGFYRFDADQNYQYRAFGVPGLGFKRGLGNDLVIAPYASLMAIGYEPDAVARNLISLLGYKMLGLYGVYESIDFTADRLLLDESSALVREYMAHHQGMIMMAMDNFFHNDVMVQRLHSDPRIQSVELLLQEQIPQAAPIQDPAADEVKGVQRVIKSTPEIIPWTVPVSTPIPELNLLSNGNYNVVLSNMGGGYSSWHGIDLTRWQPDGVLDPWGTWVYIQEISGGVPASGRLWSAGRQPIAGNVMDMHVTYFAHKVVYHRIENEIISTMEVTVAATDPVEIRRIHLQNGLGRSRNLRITSYGEVILAPQIDDSRHPAFNKLFIESEFVPELDLQIFTRRPRSSLEPTLLMGHMLVARKSTTAVRHEADRNRFIGRNQTLQSPSALNSEQYLSGTTGATLDPIFSLGLSVDIEANGIADLAYLTFTAESREDLLILAKRYHNWTVIERSFHQANIAAQTWLAKQEITSQSLKEILQVFSALLYPFKAVRAAPDIIAANCLGQPGLWRFGISGDSPIFMVEIDDPKQTELVRETVRVHKFLKSRGIKVDLVIVNRQHTDYGAELNRLLYSQINQMNSEDQINQRGGIYILYEDQMRSEEYTLLETAARVLLKGMNGSLGDQLPGYLIQVHHLPNFTPTRQPEIEVKAARPPYSLPLQKKIASQFNNGYGGFSQDGREYIIELQSGKTTPAPWVNVIGYPDFGFMVSESGSQCTWAANSGENRLTPWSNDPVRDSSGEVLYLRDEETGEVWTPTPFPSGTKTTYRVSHGVGYTIFENNSHGLNQVLTLFASPEDPVKIIHLKVKNTLSHIRRITATQYVEWVLGTTHAANLAYIIPEYDAGQECLMASNPYNIDFGKRVAFLIASKTVHGLTADRTEFLGRGGTAAFPAALRRLGLETRITAGEDPCGVLQIHLDLLPGATDEIYFVLGEGNDKDHALALANKYHDPAYVGAAFDRTHIFWEHLLNTVQVHTPEPATDIMLNRWLLYQTLSCRVWGRTAFYQSSGAFGFRDQLQDVLALLSTDPIICRGQILNAAQHQFAEGDVMHWWHPPLGRGVRTRISDDMLWLPYVTALYVEATGDMELLAEKIPFLAAPVLREGQDESYDQYPQTEQTFSLMEHCLRAIEKASTSGLHGLPLIGTGDWNDGLNRVGVKGQGESVWLAWFICDVLKRFAVICKQTGDSQRAERYEETARQYAAAVEQSAWDGAWYRRAYYDDGASLGSAQNLEAQIDIIAQSWSVLSGAGDKLHSHQAMQSVLNHLVRPNDRVALLLTPAFDKTLRDPGYIKGYLPGIRENGGQYTHAATWAAWAFAAMGEGKQAGALFDLLNPIFQSDTFEKAAVYRVEPYVISADIYSTAPYIRRGGWTWYTGSAAWMYRLGIEAILGFKKKGNSLFIEPVIPPEWDGFEIRYEFGASVYLIQVRNPDHVSHSVIRISMDGALLSSSAIPLVDDREQHIVEIIIGNENSEK
jgi:cyclic beta-1,2-glucan synthetase